MQEADEYLFEWSEMKCVLVKIGLMSLTCSIVSVGKLEVMKWNGPRKEVKGKRHKHKEM